MGNVGQEFSGQSFPKEGGESGKDIGAGKIGLKEMRINRKEEKE
jgi:hypothetical protein